MRSRTILAGAGVLAAATGLMAGATASATAAQPGGPGGPGRPGGPGGPAAGPGRPGTSAYALAMRGPVTIPAMPAVSSRGAEVRRTVLREQSTRLLTAAALDARATGRRAGSTVTGLRVPAAAFRADALTAKCHGRRGTARLANAVLAGRRLASAPKPNTTVPVEIPGAGTAQVTLNKQRRLPGGRLAVTAMEARLPLSRLGSQTLSAAYVTCGNAGGHYSGGYHTPGRDPGRGSGTGPPAPAPRPRPVNGDLPVTG